MSATSTVKPPTDEAVRKRELQYFRVWRRQADSVLHQTDDEAPHVDVYRFPPTRKPWAPARKLNVYLTGGMSTVAMAVPEELDTPRRIELAAYAKERVQNAAGVDYVAWWLHFLSHFPFRQGAFLAPMHTVIAPEPLTPSSEMVGFCFAIPPGVDAAALTRATITAELVLQVVPISKRECELAEKDGPEALLNAFDRGGIPPFFDFRRRSVV